jgi:hypothetical protein
MPESTAWWLAFLVLTIAAERLELSRAVLPSRAAQATFAAAIAFILAGAALGELTRPFAPLTGLGFLGCAAWLFAYDVARRTIRQTGQIRFSAACMIAGYGWLALAGLLLLTAPFLTTAFAYDAVVHAIAIGFVLSMVFGHALIILPAVTGLRARFTVALYVPLALLQLSAGARVMADLLEWTGWRGATGVLTVIALAVFAATLIAASICKPASRR